MIVNQKGHNTIEYIVLMTMVIVVAFGLLAQTPTGFRSKMNETYSTAANAAVESSNQLLNALFDKADQ